MDPSHLYNPAYTTPGMPPGMLPPPPALEPRTSGAFGERSAFPQPGPPLHHRPLPGKGPQKVKRKKKGSRLPEAEETYNTSKRPPRRTTKGSAIRSSSFSDGEEELYVKHRSRRHRNRSSSVSSDSWDDSNTESSGEEPSEDEQNSQVKVFYSKRRGGWTTKRPVARQEVEVEKVEIAGDHILEVYHRVLSRSKATTRLESITIISPILREALGKAFEGYPNFESTWVEVRVYAPWKPFVHRWEQYRKLVDEETDETVLEQLKLLDDVLKDSIAPILQRRANVLEHRLIAYQDLWMIFEPNCLVYSVKDGYQRVYRLDSIEEDGVFEVNCRYVDWNGKFFGYRSSAFDLFPYEGVKSITSLSAYPLHFLPGKEQVREELISRGREFEKLKGHHIKHYKGVAKSRGVFGIGPRYIDSRVVVDCEAYGQMCPSQYMHFVPPVATAAVPGDSDIVPGPPVIGLTLTDDECLLATHKVRGYSLIDKEWLMFEMSNLTDIEWDENAINDLVAPPEQKEMILSFSRAQMNRKEGFDDIIKGKGQGFIMLLSGTPGTGKTLTAETVAERMKVPLYNVSSNDLGNMATTVEANLRTVLQINSKWKSVVLIDEADVYLETRGRFDMQRNALVSVFLRLLEYFSGIMILTTNRAVTIDPAFASRIHLCLSLNELDVQARLKVWNNFLIKAKTSPPIDPQDIEKLAQHQLNGRQIKNLVKSACLLAEDRGTPLEYKDLNLVVQVHHRNTIKFGETPS